MADIVCEAPHGLARSLMSKPRYGGVPTGRRLSGTASVDLAVLFRPGVAVCVTVVRYSR
jgi:hypothetical protein